MERDTLTETDYQELVSLCRTEAELGTAAPAARPFQRGATEGTARPGASVVLVSIADVSGVNALAPKRPLVFGRSGMTVVYGDNAAGKSGYVRLLKHACGVRAPGQLRGDVFKKEPSGTATAVLTLRTGESERPFTWTPGAQDADLRRVEVFDDRRGEVYVNEENEVAYEPGGLRLLADLVSVCTKVGERIKAERDALWQSFPAMPIDLAGTEPGLWYAGLSGATTDAQVDAECTFGEEEEARLAALQVLVAHGKSQAREAELRRLSERCEALLLDLEGLSNALSRETGVRLLRLRQEHRTASEALALSADSKLGGLLPGTGSSAAWAALWAAAREYSRESAYPNRPFPVLDTEAVCVLCQQAFDSAAGDRMRAFDEFVGEALARREHDARAAVATADGALPGVWSDEELLTRLDGLGVTEASDRTLLVSLLAAARAQRATLLNARNDQDLDALVTIDTQALAPLRTRLSAFREGVKEVAAATTVEGQQSVEKQVDNLRARKWLANRKEAILGVVGKRRKWALCNKAFEDTNTGQITARKSRLTDETVTGPLLKRFGQEIEALGAQGVPVEIVKAPGEKGKSRYQLRLAACKVPSVPPEEVLSEGEFRAAALAAFLAYVVEHPTGDAIVFDDPITSLDHRYQESVAARLVALSEKRQVIVFTHSLSFSYFLQQAAGDGALSLVQLERRPWGAGEPRREVAFKVKDVLAALRTLSTSVARHLPSAPGGEDWELEGFDACRQFRVNLESVVEDVLLDGVVRRFERNLRWHKHLPSLSRITAADCLLLDGLLA
ncbi:MAG: AAA family ATPase, partial [Candidatus Limnocylindrus sp.]